ncbi:MAG: thioredoxin family protein [Bacteroidetes bacterium]|nr:thioredoxin family protein [Bacteroidota bacterium]
MKPFVLSAILFFAAITSCFAQDSPMPSAAIVMEQAMAKAKKENKKVLLIFHASWCGWCKKMEASLDDPSCKKMFDENYVITYLDVQESKGKENLENPGGSDIMKKYKGEKSGLPFWVVLDANGKPLADSQIRPAGAGLEVAGSNVGCPAEPNEIDHFVGVLKSTSRLKEADFVVIRERFSKNRAR